MNEEPDTEELRREQAERADTETHRAEEAPGEPETRQHTRRAQKAEYLRRKLEERERSERED